MQKVNLTGRNSVFDVVYKDVVCPFFETFTDSRSSNKSIPFSNFLRSGFALFSTKSKSLQSFLKSCTIKQGNLKSIYGIDKVPKATQLREVLDQVDPQKLRRCFHLLYKEALRKGVVSKLKYWNNQLILSIDGVQHFASKKVSCPNCLSRKQKDGNVSHYHAMLSASFVHPNISIVLPVEHEPIINQDGSNKNDCERNAFNRLLTIIEAYYKRQKMILTLDALYACAPVIRRISANPNWNYIIAIKPKGNKHLFAQIEEAKKKNKLHVHTCQRDGESQVYTYLNGVELNKKNKDIKVNVLLFEKTDQEGKTTHFSWITNTQLSKKNVYQAMRTARSRWHIENKVFNTLKNQGYNLNHNFGHGNKNLCTVFAYLMMLAFFCDQLQAALCILFKKGVEVLRAKTELWDTIRAIFERDSCANMATILTIIGYEYDTS